MRDILVNYKGYVICLPAQYEYAVVQYLRYDNGSSRSYICGRYIIEISYSLRTFQFYIYDDDQVILEKISEETLLPH